MPIYLRPAMLVVLRLRNSYVAHSSLDFADRGGGTSLEVLGLIRQTCSTLSYMKEAITVRLDKDVGRLLARV